MSTLAQNIANLSAYMNEAYSMISARGGALPGTFTAAKLANSIYSIPAGSGLQGYTLTITPGSIGSQKQHVIYAFDDGHTEHQYVGGDLYEGTTVTKSNVVSYIWVDNNLVNTTYQGVVLTANTTVAGDYPCLAFGTKVQLADGKLKLVEDITYDDELAVWDFERGCMSSAKPIWICKPSVASFYWKVTFKSGRILNVVGPKGHRGFSKTKQMFAYLPECVGDVVASLDGDDEVKSCNRFESDVKYTNIITIGHFNMFTNGILTSCRLNNYRQFDAAQMKFSSAGWNYHDKAEFDDTPNAMIDGLHLCEQPSSTNELLKYVSRLAATMA